MYHLLWMRNIVIALVVIVLIAIGIFAFTKQGKKASQIPQVIVSVTPAPTASSVTSPSASPSGSSQLLQDKVKEISVEGYEYKFEPATFSIKKGEKVKLTFANKGKYPHNLIISGLNVTTKTIQPDQTDTVEFTADKIGTFKYYCSVDSHEAKGMVGTLTVE